MSAALKQSNLYSPIWTLLLVFSLLNQASNFTQNANDDYKIRPNDRFHTQTSCKSNDQFCIEKPNKGKFTLLGYF